MTRPTSFLRKQLTSLARASSGQRAATALPAFRPALASSSSSSTTPSSSLMSALSSSASKSSYAGVRSSMLQKRAFTSSSISRHGELTRPAKGTGIKVHFRDSKGNDIKTVEGNEGDDLLSLAHEWDVDLEGACERSLACSTCHVILEPQVYDKLPEPEDEENDMLDLAFGLEDTSRLGCQVYLKKDLDGMVVKLPAATRNMYVDGAKARTH